MPLTLTRRLDAMTLPIEAGDLRPEALAGLSATEVARLALPVGNARAEVGELFVVEGSSLGPDDDLVFEGDLGHLRAVGSGMTTGRIVARGGVGPRAGLGMLGGELTIDGSAGVYAGAEMLGGLIRIRGDAGDGLGAALPGSRLGMREGVILVDGSAGDDAGLAMRRGLIAVRGGVGEGLGRGLVAGSLFAFGPVGPLAGLGMKRGTLALFGLDRPELPPIPVTFAPSGRGRPPFLAIYLKALRAWGFDVPPAVLSGDLARYNGDRGNRGRGEVWVWGE